MRQDARPAMKAELSPGPIWLPLLPKTSTLADVDRERRIDPGCGSPGPTRSVAADFRFSACACCRSDPS
jgi:hypothetical protein